jgi:hypothetical protein
MALIEKNNRAWEDLAAGWGEPALLTVTHKQISPGFQPDSE